MSQQSKTGRVWGLTLRDRVLIALVGALIVAAKFYIHIPMRVPGHTGIFWMALLIIGAGVVGRPGAGTLIGVVSGVLAAIFLPQSQGPLAGVKYFAPGLVVDLLTPLLGGRLDRLIPATVVGAAANMSKLGASYLLGLAMGVPGGYLAIGLGYAATTHLVFGALGGLAGALVLGRLARAGVPGPPETVAAPLPSEEPAA